ncbi:MAG: pantetheine-phosphate adenylyltransferase [Nitrososphaeria archaeon]|nr:pantetheine-phosphate adenylyltransferase [Nitrososphaeria archaeon]
MKDYKMNPLWNVLVEVVKGLPKYEEHKAHVRDEILVNKPDITAQELSEAISIPLGEAMVILEELRISHEEVEEELLKELPKPKYRLVALGGTFSKLHYGHLMLLLTGIRSGEKIIIGVTTDDFAKKLGKRYEVPPYEMRARKLMEELIKRGWIDKCLITPIEDPYGVTIEKPEIEVLVTSPYTYFRGSEINRIRRERGMKPLEIIVCPLVVAEDGKPISSTRIFLGEVTETGRIAR